MRLKLSAFDVAEALHLAYAASALQQAGVFAYLQSPRPLQEISFRFRMDVSILRAALDYLAERTDLIVIEDGAYRTTEQYDLSAQFILDQYLGAYGPNSASVMGLLRDPSRASHLVNQERRAAAFSRLPGPGVAVLPDVLEELEANHLLDLGCGPGALLVAMAQRKEDFLGWGLDVSSPMCEAARERISVAGVADRIEIFEGNCFEAGDILPADVRDQTRVLTAASLLNEFFSPSAEAVIELLRYLKHVFPNRLLINVDYYGALGYVGTLGSRRTLLHDYVQTISGQGIPPANDVTWEGIYKAAGCKLLHSFHTQSGESFVHLVQLSTLELTDHI